MPCRLGNAPVPIEACAHAVTAGNDPTIALRKFALSPIRRRRFGHLSGKLSRTFQPPPSITKVITTLGFRADRDVAIGSDVPRRSFGQSAPIRAAVVGARSAS